MHMLEPKSKKRIYDAVMKYSSFDQEKIDIAFMLDYIEKHPDILIHVEKMVRLHEIWSKGG